jgi:hypothetical protein
MKELVPERLYEDYARGIGYTWTLKAPRCEDIEVWKEDNGTIRIRQEEGRNVDLISLNVGQAYDLLKALARALEV